MHLITIKTTKKNTRKNGTTSRHFVKAQEILFVKTTNPSMATIQQSTRTRLIMIDIKRFAVKEINKS